MCSRCVPQTPVGWVGHLCAPTVSRDLVRRPGASPLWWAVGGTGLAVSHAAGAAGRAAECAPEGSRLGLGCLPSGLRPQAGVMVASGAAGSLSPR